MNYEIQDLLELVYTDTLRGSSGELVVKNYIDELLRNGYCKEYLYKIMAEEFQILKPPSVRMSIFALYYTKPVINYIYKLYEDDHLIYIGQSSSLYQRLKAHKRDKTFSKTEIYMCQFYQNPDHLEAWLINKYQPHLNKNLNLRFARLWKEREPVFKDIMSPECLFITTPSYLKDKDKYLCAVDREYPYIRNDRDIQPYWK